MIARILTACFIALSALVSFLSVSGSTYPDRQANHWTRLEDERIALEQSGADQRRLAMIFWQEGKYEKAYDVLMRTQNLWRGKLPDSSPYNKDFAQNQLDLASLFMDWGTFAEAEKWYRDVLKYDTDHAAQAGAERIARDENNLGVLFELKGEGGSTPSDRRQLFEQSLSFLRQAEKTLASVPENRQAIDRNHVNQALVLTNLGKQAEAHDLIAGLKNSNPELGSLCWAY